MYNIDPFYSDAFVQTYHKINPLDAAVLAVVPGKVLASSYITQTDSFRACAFYNEFFRPQGHADTVGIGPFRTPIAAGYLALQRSPNAIWVEPEQWQLLETLGPHLQRAAAIHKFLSRARAATESIGAAVAAAGFAVFFLTGDCRVVFANAKAEDLVRRWMGLRYERGGLRPRALAHRAPECAHAPGGVSENRRGLRRWHHRAKPRRKLSPAYRPCHSARPELDRGNLRPRPAGRRLFRHRPYRRVAPHGTPSPRRQSASPQLPHETGHRSFSNAAGIICYI